MLSRLKPHGSLKNDVLQPWVMSAFLGKSYLTMRRKAAYMLNKLKGSDPTIDIFVAADDAHSYVLLQCAQKILKRYKLQASVCVLPPGTNGWASSYDVKYNWALRDAGLLATLYGMDAPSITDRSVQAANFVTQQMHTEATRAATGGGAEVVDGALQAMSTLWGPAGCWSGAMHTDSAVDLEANSAHLKRLGYYNPGAIHFQGEFYPPNRLHHLEARLQSDFNVDQDTGNWGAMLFNQEVECETDINYLHIVSELASGPPLEAAPPVELFYSFRSPYSQLILPRIRRICSHYGRSLVLRPVLPMVTRGFKVPLEKQLYIVRDAKREADLWNIPFGEMIDPLYPDKMPFLRAFDAYGVALKYGKEYDFVESYGMCQWGKGISAGTDEGLKAMLVMSGLADKWGEVQSVIKSESAEEKFAKWEGQTAANREYLTDHGLWGVPCLRYKDVILFGQDKLWAIKTLLANELQQRGAADSCPSEVDEAGKGGGDVPREGQRKKSSRNGGAGSKKYDENQRLVAAIVKYGSGGQ